MAQCVLQTKPSMFCGLINCKTNPGLVWYMNPGCIRQIVLLFRASFSGKKHDSLQCWPDRRQGFQGKMTSHPPWANGSTACCLCRTQRIVSLAISVLASMLPDPHRVQEVIICSPDPNDPLHQVQSLFSFSVFIQDVARFWLADLLNQQMAKLLQAIIFGTQNPLAAPLQLWKGELSCLDFASERRSLHVSGSST